MALGKDVGVFWSRGIKGLGPGKTLCDTEEKTLIFQLSDPIPEIGGISPGAKAIVAF